ncbi:hypothetical protein D3C81_1787960 [compost metagenome]
MVESAEQWALPPFAVKAPGGGHDHFIHQQAQAVGVSLEGAGFVVELGDFFHHADDLVMNVLVQGQGVAVLRQALQAHDQADQGHGGITQWVPGQPAQLELGVAELNLWRVVLSLCLIED